MALLSDRDREAVRQALGGLTTPLTLRFYTQTVNCESCLPTRQILDEVVALSDKLTLEEHDFLLDTEAVQADQVERVPAIVLAAGDRRAIRFYGAPAGYEFSSLIDALIVAGGGGSGLSEKSRETLATVTEPLHIQVFVTPT
jgi:alkyl hydroperoxide reductase subunit AhpF